jgi:hypothetical protein
LFNDKIGSDNIEKIFIEKNVKIGDKNKFVLETFQIIQILIENELPSRMGGKFIKLMIDLE